MNKLTSTSGRRGLAHERLVAFARRSAIILPVAMLAGCATVSSEQNAFYSDQTHRLESTGAVVISDGCILRDEATSADFALLTPSAAIARSAGVGIGNVIASHSSAPVRVITPFACGGTMAKLKADDQGLYPAAETKSDTVHPQALPLVLDDSIKGRKDLMDAYRDLLTKGENATIGPGDGGAVPSAQPLGLTDDEVRLLRSATGSTNLWVVRAAGVQVSLGKAIGVGLLTAALTLGTAYSVQSDGHGYDIALIDLDHNQVLWTRHTGGAAGDPTNAVWYTGKLAANMLAPFYVDEATASAAAGASAVVAPAAPAAGAAVAAAPAPAPATADATAAQKDAAISWHPGAPSK